MSRAPVPATRAVLGGFWWEYQILRALQARDVRRLTYLVDLAEAQERVT